MRHSGPAPMAARRNWSGWWLALAALMLMPFSAAAGPLQAHGFKMAGDALRVRIVLQFDREPDPKWFLLRAPHRLVVDLPQTEFAVDPRELKPRGLVSDVRFGDVGEGRSRLILTAQGPFAVDRVDVTKNESSAGFRLVADLSATSDSAYDAALADQAATTGSTVAASASPVKDVKAPVNKRFTIVIDPGHGGIDGGAAGLHRTVEKDITLAFAKDLRNTLGKTGDYDIFLTRSDDTFLRLDERVRIARQHNADLFISIHADTIRLKGIRGATVYTVSDKASDAQAAALAARENLSDQLAGIEIEDDHPEVADILVDLIRRETHSFSVRFARSLVGELSNSVELINNPHRSAGFRVLKAPDVPSVLVELGYLSNAKDEAQLKDPAWRHSTAERIAAAVAAFAGDRIAATGG